MQKLAHVAEYKKREVAELVKLLEEYSIIGILNMENLPAAQLVRMRKKIRENAVLRMSKKSLIIKAIDQVKDKQGIEGLKSYLAGMPALIFTRENPFKIYKFIAQRKSPAPAKPGQTAPKDLIIPAGATPFAPGPIIGEFGQIGVKTGVEAGKVVVKQDTVVVKQGAKITEKAASILLRLGIQPMEVGLDLVVVYENSSIFGKDILAVDEDKYIADIMQAAQWAVNLSVEGCYATKVTIEIIIVKAYNESKNLAVDAEILAEGIIDIIIAKAEREMLTLKEEIKL